MILNSQEISELGIVTNPTLTGQRQTTYDATVGDILLKGIPIEGDRYTIPRRGLVWVVSQEEFHLPNNVTGLATLRTTWTHGGVLALNVGIVDPGWNGPLATAIVNFSEKEFAVTKGEPFFRVLFHKHSDTSSANITRSKSQYLREISDKSARFSDTFLNLNSLAREVLEQIFTFPRWVNRLAMFGLLIAVLSMIITLMAVFVPVAYGISTEYLLRGLKIQKVESDLQETQKEVAIQAETIKRLEAISSNEAGSAKRKR